MDFQLLADPFTFIAGFGVIGIIVAVVASLFWLWMLIDVLTNASLKGTEKIVWLLVVLFLHLLGALLYYFMARGGSRGGAAI